MLEIEVRRVGINEIILNPNNPRTITEKDMAKLAKSLSDFPEMLEIREIVVDETMTVLGGNMRTLVLRQAGARECLAKVVRGLTDEQKREFVIKDNGGFGQWDSDALADSWGDLPLEGWGINVPKWAGPDGAPPKTEPGSGNGGVITCPECGHEFVDG